MARTPKPEPDDDTLRDRAFWTVRSVARVMGINFSEEMAAGRFGRSGYCEMIDTCLHSHCMGRCSEWLGRGAGCASAPPPGCANADRFTKLRRRLC